MKLRALVVFIFAMLVSVPAHACSVCYVTNDASRYAYYATTILLSFLPLAMIGGVIYYIAKKYR